MECERISGDQRHRLGTEPTPLSQQAFDISVIDTKPILHLSTNQRETN
jgi:hypothetical protein